jgi:hypothetical protein
VLVFGIVWTSLSAATAGWRWARGEPIGPELGLITGGLIVLFVGLYLEFRRDRS